MLNIVNLALAITTSFAMTTALSFVAYNYWQDSQIEKKLKSSASEFENAKISIEKDHVQAIEALDKFDKKLEESEKQIDEALNEFNKKRKEKLSEADHKTKKSEPPKFINPALSTSIQSDQKVEDSSSESGYPESDNSGTLSENIVAEQNTDPKKRDKHYGQSLNSTKCIEGSFQKMKDEKKSDSEYVDLNEEEEIGEGGDSFSADPEEEDTDD